MYIYSTWMLVYEYQYVCVCACVGLVGMVGGLRWAPPLCFLLVHNEGLLQPDFTTTPTVATAAYTGFVCVS